MGEGISPDKKKRTSKQKQQPFEDEETQHNKEKTRKILQNFDFNKLFYPTHGQPKQRNAKSLNERRRLSDEDKEDFTASRHGRGKNLPSQPP